MLQYDRKLIRLLSLMAIFVLAALLPIGCGNQQNAWEIAQRDNNPTAYLEFLAKYPDSKFADEARARMEALKEINAWERAEFRDSLSGYASFIEKYPNSEYVTQANQNISNIERDEVWAIVQDADDPEVVAAFLRDYPESKQAAEAAELLKTLEAVAAAEAPTERDGDFRLQLGAFRTAKSADIEVRRLVALFPDTLLGPVRIETPSQDADRKLFVLKSVPMSREEANSACASLKKLKQVCLVIKK